MKLFFDYLPIIAFVGIYFYIDSDTPLYPAVQGLMVASVIQTIGARLITGKFEKLHLWMLVVTLVFGALTLAFRAPEFVQWKASIVVWIMAAVFLFRQLVQKKYLIKDLLKAALDEGLSVPEKVWRQTNLIWPIGYFLFGFLNLYIAFNFSEAFWVKFKLFGLMGLTFALMAFTIYKLFPYFAIEDSPQSPNKDSQQLDDKSHTEN
ncbi:inner membrane-spanning protein YciB [Aliikangiella sp. IMCC44653]